MAFQLNVSFGFIHFRGAFNSVEREMISKIRKQYRLPKKVVNVISNSYEGFKCSIKSEGEKGQMFDVRSCCSLGDL